MLIQLSNFRGSLYPALLSRAACDLPNRCQEVPIYLLSSPCQCVVSPLTRPFLSKAGSHFLSSHPDPSIASSSSPGNCAGLKYPSASAAGAQKTPALFLVVVSSLFSALCRLR